MPNPADPIPVVLFAYARPAHLRRVLASLRADRVPRLEVFADGAKGPADRPAVEEVRRLLRAIDWCEVRLVERPRNLGLGRNVLDGVSDVASRHEIFVVWEDDLISVPGTYAWLCAALRHYADEPRVMSVTAWTHPLVKPATAGDQPYFDGRAECWVWGTYARAWAGMERTAREKMAAVRAQGLAPAAYGADLPRMARSEQRRNIWAVRWLYHHLEYGGLCLRPPWSLVEHIGFDATASNAAGAGRWANPPLRPAPPIPGRWPPAVEQPDCRARWQQANPSLPLGDRLKAKAMGMARAGWRRAVPAGWRQRLRRLWAWQWFRGDYATWAEARAASGGYDDRAIVDRILAAALATRTGQAAFERDGVLFHEPAADEALMAALAEAAGAPGSGWRVLDFGGSLGSTYWRHRDRLPSEAALRWDVVEQPGFVAAGREHLQSGPLRFFHDIGDAEAAAGHDILLCSCVLQYLEAPARVLAEWRQLPVPYLLLNNLPLHATGPDRLRVQHVPPSIYPASYPVWFFNREAFLARLAPDYDLVREFASEAVWPVDGGMYPSTGLLLKRKRGRQPAT